MRGRVGRSPSIQSRRAAAGSWPRAGRAGARRRVKRRASARCGNVSPSRAVVPDEVRSKVDAGPQDSGDLLARTGLAVDRGETDSSC